MVPRSRTPSEECHPPQCVQLNRNVCSQIRVPAPAPLSAYTAWNCPSLIWELQNIDSSHSEKCSNPTIFPLTVTWIYFLVISFLKYLLSNDWCLISSIILRQKFAGVHFHIIINSHLGIEKRSLTSPRVLDSCDHTSHARIMIEMLNHASHDSVHLGVRLVDSLWF